MPLLNGIHLLFSIASIVAIIVGAVAGILLGSLPGIGPVFVLAVFLTVTEPLPAEPALAFLVSAYTAAIFGGSITAILFNVPGHPGNIATTFDGPKLAKQGRAGETVVAVALCGAVGASAAGLLTLFAGPAVTNLALHLQPVDYLMLAVLGLSLVAGVSGKKVIGGLALGSLGVALATSGPDLLTGGYRYSFGNGFLHNNGIPIVVVAVGLFAMGSGLLMLEENATVRESREQIASISLRGSIVKGIVAFIARPAAIFRSVVLGFVVGVVPGLGITLSNLGAYFLEKKLKPKENWGEGNITGPMVAEAADGATIVSELVPALTLGIPGAATSALILVALGLHGITVGPEIFVGKHAALIVAFLLAIPLSQIVIVLVGILLSPVVATIARVPQNIVGPLILAIGAVGAFIVNGSFADIVLAVIFGILGYMILKLSLPLAPLIMGMLLGPLLEENLSRVLTLDNVTHSNAFFQPLALSLGFLSCLAILGPTLFAAVRRHWSRRSQLIDNEEETFLEGSDLSNSRKV